MRSGLILSCLVLVIVLVSACSKSDSGSGSNLSSKYTSGSAVLKVNLMHHNIGHNLIDCMVYIKYNTLDKPANGVYDDSAIANNMYSDTLQTALFTKLINSNYYLYGKGYDTSGPFPVFGGGPCTINAQDTQTVDLAVSEN